MLLDVHDAPTTIAEAFNGVLCTESMNKRCCRSIDLEWRKHNGINATEDDIVNLHRIHARERWTVRQIY